MKKHAGAEEIHRAFHEVALLRSSNESHRSRGVTLRALKAFQSKRFEHTYHDLLASEVYGPPCDFFLKEIYGDKDFSQRDRQFERIAASVERMFPRNILEMAVDLAELHALTELLDTRMAEAMESLGYRPSQMPLDSGTYAVAWRTSGLSAQRTQQLEMVLELGNRLDRITTMRGVRFTLRAMRLPARAANLSALQSLLEKGFETFSGLAQLKGCTAHFLNTIAERESAWIRRLDGSQ
ncbi:MAG: hypothetical protein U5L73_17150 [Rhodoferax sp.]|uniref:FFLEELY motif protein n=1 Tax=Rhodoferax sp. TaxID=50421 RepID=UPI002ACD8178|nr:hypothetical protein [Rhodoferax sp.]MDZ7893469.1 hypothetical protein [Rhodoferax sp.]